MWQHKKFKGKKFKGMYDETTKSKGRCFVLVWSGVPKGHKIPNMQQFTFESWQMAKRQGWTKCK